MPERVLVFEVVLVYHVEMPSVELDLGTAEVRSSLSVLLEKLHWLPQAQLVVP